MRRRGLLASAAAALPTLVAGCTSAGGHVGNAVGEVPTARLEMEAITDSELPEKVLYTVRPSEGNDPTARFFDRVLEGGATTKATRPPLPEDQHIAYQDGVYELSYEVTEQTPATRYSVKVDIVTDSIQDAKTVHFSELPDVDQDKFDDHGLGDGETIGIGTTFLYTDTEGKQSVLVPESEYSYIIWENGNKAEWVVDDAYDTTLNTYRYTADKVATAAEYGKQMRERFVFTLSGLPDAQQDIVRTAIEDGRYIVDPDEELPDAVVALADRFREHEQAHGLDVNGEGDLNGSYLTQYQDDVYWTTFVVQSGALQTATSN